MTSEYNRWPDKAGPSRRHFGWADDRSIASIKLKMIIKEPITRNNVFTAIY